jgi:hypothetical protein
MRLHTELTEGRTVISHEMPVLRSVALRKLLDDYCATSKAIDLRVVAILNEEMVRAVQDEPMPWCDHCQCWHHVTAECIRRT